MLRSTWDEYFMSIAIQVAQRSTCSRKHMGAVLVRDHYILTTGYNGSVLGLDHCDDVGHIMDADCESCIRTVHAEANAVAQAAYNGVSVKDSKIYVTSFPCFSCFKLLANSGVKHIIYREEYQVDDKVFDLAVQLGLRIDRIE